MKRDPADNGGAGETYMEISTTGRDETRRHCDGDETTQTSFLGTSIFSCVTDECNDCPGKVVSPSNFRGVCVRVRKTVGDVDGADRLGRGSWHHQGSRRDDPLPCLWSLVCALKLPDGFHFVSV